MVLRDGEVDLERRADGLRNWRLGHPDYRGPGRFKVLSIRGEADRARLTSACARPARRRRRRLRPDCDASAAPIAGASGAGGAADVADADPARRSRRVASACRSSSAPRPARRSPSSRPGGRFALRGQHRPPAVRRLDVDGRLGDIVREPLVDARVALAAPSLAPFAAPFIASPRRDPRTIRGRRHLKAGDGNYDALRLPRRVSARPISPASCGWTRGEQRERVARSR